MTKYYKATFSDGFVTKRSTASRTYSHAWRVGRITGFSARADLARKACASGWEHLGDLVREIAPVEEITAKEYRSAQ